MAPKRPHDEPAPPEPSVTKKTKRGFRVGPDNLPDGPWRRKIIKTKQELIHKAKIKKSYARLRARELASHTSIIPDNESGNAGDEDEGEGEGEQDNKEKNNDVPIENGTRTPTGPERHPDRQRVLDAGKAGGIPDVFPRKLKPRPGREAINDTKAAVEAESSDETLQARPQSAIYARAARGAARKEAQLEAAREKERQRREALRQRDRRRNAISKAQGRRGAKMGKQKLGRQGNVLLDQIKKMVGESGVV